MTKSSGPQPSVHLRVVTTDEGFAQLREPWNALVAHIDGHVFLRHEWFVAAWAWRRSEASLKILCAYADNVLVGVLPLIHPPDTSHGTRLLEYLSVPDAQLCDLLVDPAAGPAVGCAVADHLLATAPMWDQLCIDRLPADSAAQRWLAPVLAGKEVMAQFHAVAPQSVRRPGCIVDRLPGLLVAQHQEDAKPRGQPTRKSRRCQG